jgi:hypothetical protein
MASRRAAPHSAAHGTHAAAALAPDRTEEALAEFRRLNTREARAAFADYWIGIWAQDFEYAWPMVYELLSLVNEEELFRDPRRVGPSAPGAVEAHGVRGSYDSFAEYFEDRAKSPFERWAELESTYHYARDHAPGLMATAFSAASTMREADERDRENQRPVGVNQHSEGVDNVNTLRPAGNTQAAALRRLRKDAPELHADVLAGRISPHAAMIKAGFRRHTMTIRADDPESAARTLSKLPRETRHRLAELLLAADEETP